MGGKGLSTAVFGVIATITVYFATISSGLLRVFFIAILLLILMRLLYFHTHRQIFLAAAFLITSGSLFCAYKYLYGHVPPPSSELNRLEMAFRDARERYNVSDFEGTIKILEPFISAANSFDTKLVEDSYHLLGLAYLSLPEPRCSDAFRLIPSISQRSLEHSLAEKCKAVSCRQCQGGGLL
jgi:hypothetical protein